MSKLIDIHNNLMNKNDFHHLVSDTGTYHDGWAVLTLSCKKKDFIEKLKKIIKEAEKWKK